MDKKNPSQYISFFFIATVFLLPLLGLSLGKPGKADEKPRCSIDFKNEADQNETIKVTKECFKKFPLKFSNDSDSFDQKQFFSDNAETCAFKCVAEGLYKTKNGLLDPTGINNYLAKYNMTAALSKFMADELIKCGKSTEKSLEGKGGAGKNLCRYHLLVSQCTQEHYETNKDEMEKLCSQK